MATIEEQKEALLEAFSGLIQEATGLDVYLFGQEFTRPAGRYIAMNILSSRENGTALADMFDADGYYSSIVNYDIRITVTAYRYDAFSPLGHSSPVSGAGSSALCCSELRVSSENPL